MGRIELLSMEQALEILLAHNEFSSHICQKNCSYKIINNTEKRHPRAILYGQ